MEMGAAIDLQWVNECKAQHRSHRPNTCWFFLWRFVVRLPAPALVNYTVRITKSYRPLSSWLILILRLVTFFLIPVLFLTSPLTSTLPLSFLSSFPDAPLRPGSPAHHMCTGLLQAQGCGLPSVWAANLWKVQGKITKQEICFSKPTECASLSPPDLSPGQILALVPSFSSSRDFEQYVKAHRIKHKFSPGIPI